MLIEHRALEADQVELVDREHDVPDAEQRADQRMSPGLHQHAFARVDEQHRQIGVRRAGRHVARVLLVPGAVGDDERAPRRREIAVGDIDGNALLPLVFEPIEQTARNRSRRRSCQSAANSCFSASSWSPMTISAFVQQPADQRRFAVIDRAAGQKPQEALVGHRGRGDRPGIGSSRHQKYPSRFLRSIEAVVIVVDQPALPLGGARRCAVRR